MSKANKIVHNSSSKGLIYLEDDLPWKPITYGSEGYKVLKEGVGPLTPEFSFEGSMLWGDVALIAEVDDAWFIKRKYFWSPEIYVTLLPTRNWKEGVRIASKRVPILSEVTEDILIEGLSLGFSQKERHEDLAFYVYRTEDIANFHGSELKNLRRKSRKYKKDHPDAQTIVSTDVKGHFDTVNSLIQKWALEVGGDKDKKCAIDYELSGIQKILDSPDQFESLLVIQMDESEPVGFGLTLRLSEDISETFFQKSSRQPNHKYLDASLSQRVASEVWTAWKTPWLSWQEDTDDKGLREYKQSYHPILRPNRWTLINPAHESLSSRFS